MVEVLNLIVAFGLFAVVFSKKPHVKEDLEEKDKHSKSFMNLFSNDEEHATNERYARHMQTVTESVLEHLIDELKKQYFSKTYNANSPILRLIRNLKKEMKRNEHTKMIRDKLKKKMALKLKKKATKKYTKQLQKNLWINVN